MITITIKAFDDFSDDPATAFQKDDLIERITKAVENLDLTVQDVTIQVE